MTCRVRAHTYISRMRPARVFSLAVCAVIVASCALERLDVPQSPKKLFDVTITPDSSAIAVGMTLQMTATVSHNTTNAAYSLVWTSSDSTKAPVDSAGLVRGKAASPGVAICATASGPGAPAVENCATVIVMPSPQCPGPTGSLTPSVDTLRVGDVVQFQIPPAQLSGRTPGEIRWTLSNYASASIDSLTGIVTAVSAGAAGVKATDPVAASPCPHEWLATVVVR